MFFIGPLYEYLNRRSKIRRQRNTKHADGEALEKNTKEKGDGLVREGLSWQCSSTQMLVRTPYLMLRSCFVIVLPFLEP